MSHQVKPGTVAGLSGPEAGGAAAQTAYVPQTPGSAVIRPPDFHGKAMSWVAVTIVIAGFLAGGLALCFGPVWWAFWLGVALAVVGGLLGLATNIFDDWY